MSATPERSLGSTSPPLLIKSCAEIRGVTDLWTTTTRKPFGSVFSTGLGKLTERGAAAGGGVACGVWANTLTANQRSANGKRASVPFLVVIVVFIAHALLLLPYSTPGGQTSY